MPSPTIEDDTDQQDTDQYFDPRDSDSYNPTVQHAQEQKGARGASSDEPVSKLEDNGNAPESTHVNNFEGKKSQSKVEGTGFIDRVKRNKKWFATGGIAGIGIAVPVLILSAMPLKLEMYIQNITSIATSVPGYATERRLEYLITRALAVRLFQVANSVGEADAKLIFCKNGGVGCALFATYSGNYFEKKFGITIEATRNGGRLGGAASSWDIALDRNQLGGSFEGVTRRISNHSEMRALIKKEVDNKTKNVIARFAGKKLLMMRYGVKNWRGPPKIENKVDEFANKIDNARSNVKSTIYKATIGKVSPRLALYMSCLTDASACDKLREKLLNDVSLNEPDPDDEKYEGDGGDEQYEKDKAKYEAQKAVIEGTSNPDADGDSGGPLKRVLTKKVLAIAGGAGAVVGILDMVFSAVGAIGDGAMEEIWYDLSSQTYIGFANEVMIINEKWKAGDMDADTMAALFELFENAESSPLAQAENGLTVDTTQGITVECNSGVDDSGDPVKELMKLEPGELVCEDQQVVRDYTEMFQTNPALATLNTVAAGWNNSIGAVIDTIGDGIGAFLSALPGFNELMALVGGAVEPFINWLVGLIFEPPATGEGASSSDNYLALSAGIRTTENAMFEEGVDDEGLALGGGGEVLTNEEVAVITEEWRTSEEEHYNSQPLLAKLFDVSLSGSFAQRMVASVPTSWGALLGMPSTSFSQLFNGTKSFAASTSQSTINPFNLPMYGYSPDDPVFTSDPSIYNEAYCKASAEARKNSLTLDKTISPIKIYTVTDPCALEKMIVGAELFANGQRDDENSLQDIRSTE